MNDRVAVSLASYIAASRVLRRSGARLFRRFQEQLAVSICLATFVCLPGRCQDAGNSAIRQLAEGPSSRPERNVCFLPSNELCAGATSADPLSTHSRSSDGAIKKTFGRFGMDQAGIYSAPFHRSNLKWDALFLAGTGGFIPTDGHSPRRLPTNHRSPNRDNSSTRLLVA